MLSHINSLTTEKYYVYTTRIRPKEDHYYLIAATFTIIERLACFIGGENKESSRHMLFPIVGAIEVSLDDIITDVRHIALTSDGEIVTRC